MTEKIKLECSNGFTLHTEGANLIISTKKQDETIPISRIQSFSLKKPGLAFGTIVFNTAQAASAGINVGFGIATAIGAERKFFYPKRSLPIACQLRDYVVGYEERQMSPEKSSSTADEIRAMKTLLDDEIISQAEFDAKKAQLLGL